MQLKVVCKHNIKCIFAIILKRDEQMIVTRGHQEELLFLQIVDTQFGTVKVTKLKRLITHGDLCPTLVSDNELGDELYSHKNCAFSLKEEIINIHNIDTGIKIFLKSQ